MWTSLLNDSFLIHSKSNLLKALMVSSDQRNNELQIVYRSCKCRPCMDGIFMNCQRFRHSIKTVSFNKKNILAMFDKCLVFLVYFIEKYKKKYWFKKHWKDKISSQLSSQFSSQFSSQHSSQRSANQDEPSSSDQEIQYSNLKQPVDLNSDLSYSWVLE